MSYLTRESRTDILLETLQDAEKLVGVIQPGMKLTETLAVKMSTALQMIYMAARRHPDWPVEAVAMPATPEPVPVNEEPVVGYIAEDGEVHF